MYCFPYPDASSVAPLRVPYIAASKYSLTGNYDFNSFYQPFRGEESSEFMQQFARLDLSLVAPLLRPPPASVIQAWLFFGLATEALGRDIVHKEFWIDATVDNSEASIDVRLPDWFGASLRSRWADLQRVLPAATYSAKLGALMRCCLTAVIIVGLQDQRCQEADGELSLVLLSVHMLLSLIGGAFKDIKFARTNAESGSTNFLMRRMLHNGWCRRRLNFLNHNRMYYPTLYYMSSLPLPQGDVSDHRSCTAEKCFVTAPLMTPLHRKADCECQDIHVPLEPVLKIIAAGGIPLMRIMTSESGNINLQVVPYTRTTRFTAISHVWADRQLGSAANALPRCQVDHLHTMLSALPPTVDDLRFLDWLPGRLTSMLPNRPYIRPLYFWLDTFCIPQAEQHADLRLKTIESMNMIYAAAAQTLVLDKGLQNLDVGTRPASMVEFSNPTFNAPSNEKLLDALAYICGSTWMGRAWTLQEGVLSGMNIVQFKNSLGYLKLLRPHHDEKLSWFDIPRSFINLSPEMRDQPGKEKDIDAVHDGDLWRRLVQQELYEYATSSLHVEEYSDYVRSASQRAARFVDTHQRLQSRTTTMSQDLALILMNLSGLNGNLISHAGSPDEKAKLLYYGIGTLPVELLFSTCSRLGSCETDSWIPREVVAETFQGQQVLQLEPQGFTFQQKESQSPFKFCLVPRTAIWQSRMLLSIVWRPEDAETRYVVKAAMPESAPLPVASAKGWCILLEAGDAPTRAARFKITRRVANKVFLHYDCPLRLTEVDEDQPAAEPLPSCRCTARTADSQDEFLIERSTSSEALDMARPQNPDQYADRLDVVIGTATSLLSLLERWLSKRLLGSRIEGWSWVGAPYFLLYFIWSMKQRQWVDRAIRAFVHRAWQETYSPGWKPDGPWKWFWKLSNWEPPVPFKTMMKWFCQITFSIYAMYGLWGPLMVTTLYWYPLFPTSELLGMYITSFGLKFMMRAIGFI